MAHNSNHSFYREQEKSILGQQKWTPKRIGKLSWTILKWFVWGFLIIATLWGCVNEFIIQTSNNLGQGVEFYQADDFVYPNTYQAINAIGYTATNDEVTENIQTTTEDYTTQPFNFMVVDSEYDPSNTDHSEYYVSSDKLEEMYAYNLNQVTALATGIYTYDHSEVKAFNSSAWYVPTVAIAKTWADEANEDIKTWNLNKEKQYTVSSSRQYIFYLADKADGTNDGIAANGGLDKFATFKKDDSGNVLEHTYKNVIWESTPMLNTTSVADYTNIDNWTPIHTLNGVYNEKDEKADQEESINNQIILAINKFAFNSGQGTADFSSLPQELQDSFTDFASDNSLDITKGKAYQADFTIAKPAGTKVYGGAQTMVVPISKGFPVRIDEYGKTAINGITGDGFRKKGFQNWDTKSSQNQSGFDVENQMYGWTILDASYGVSYLKDGSDGSSEVGKDKQYQASLLRVYDDATAAAENNVYELDSNGKMGNLNEDNFFYADQRRQGWGVVGEGQTSTEYSVMDEKIKSWMNDKKYIHMVGSSTVGTKAVQYDYGSQFAGMTSIEQYSNTGDNDSSDGKGDVAYTGVMPRIQNGYETSLFSDSIIPTRQDSWGESRVTFIGWADWGKAWNVQYGPLYGAFVFPLAQLAMGIGEIFNYMSIAWGVIISITVIVFLTRGLGALLSLKGTANQMKMQEVQTDVAKIKAKYSKYDLKAEPRMKQKQQAEIMALYRKKEINPMGSLGTIFITMPIFISLWIIISSLPAYKVVFMGQFTWAVSSFWGMFNMGWFFLLYLLIGISVGLVQGISSKVPTWLSNKRKGIKTIDEATKAAQKKQNKTQNIMIGVFVFMGLTVPALFAFYWICSGFFTIILELIKHAWKVHVAKQMKLDQNYQTPMFKLKQWTKNTFRKKA